MRGRRDAARRRSPAARGPGRRCAANSSSAAMRARSAEPRSIVVSGGQVRARRARCCPCPRPRRRRGTSMPASRSAASAPTAIRSLAQRIASGFACAEQPLGGAPAGLDHEVVGDDAERVVAARARTSAARRGSRARRAAPGTVCGGPLTNAIRRRPTAWRWRTASAAPLRDLGRIVSTRRALRRRADARSPAPPPARARARTRR